MIHLHCHSMYSLRDSIVKPKELAERLLEINQNAIAITDHGGTLGSINIYKELKKNGIKYIHGCEFYICDDLTVKNKDNKYSHLVVLCKNEIGRLNLNKLISLSELPENFYSRPRISFELLDRYGEGLIITSACLAGEVPKAIEAGNIEFAAAIANKYKNRFGEDYYLEIQARKDEKQIELNRMIVELAKTLSIEIVVTTDVHHILEEDRKYQIKYAFNGKYKEDGESYLDCYLQSEDEIKNNLLFLDTETINRAIANTHIVADKCLLEMPLSAPIMPRIDTPKEYQSNKDWLIDICKEGFQSRLNIDLRTRSIYDKNRTLTRYTYDEDKEDLTEFQYSLNQDEINQYIDRFNYELDSLDRMGFIDYILLVYSYSQVAKRKGIARGSGGGSIVCFLSRITNIDPIEHGLYFERFIDVGALDDLEKGNITRSELKIPDIDLDFGSDSCKEILLFLHNEYGADNVASIGKFGNNQTKGTIRDMCRVLDIELKIADLIAKSFENCELDDVDAIINGTSKKTDITRTAYEYVLEYPELFEYVRKLNGLPKSFGLHSCGKVISTKELDYFLPSCYDKNGVRYLQGDMHDVEDVGLVKVDVLGLRTVDQIYDTLEMSGESEDFIDSKKQNFSDPKVIDIFRNVDTVGIFQMASYGMKETLKKMDVSGIEDLSVVNALYRPGAMAHINTFCKRRRQEEETVYLHDDLIDILKNTYAIIVFQEQLIEIGRLAGLKNPDLLRKATGKKDINLLQQIKPELQEKLLNRKWSEEQFEQLWEDMIAFARYSFNKCVSGKTKLNRAGQIPGQFNPTIEEMFKIMHDVNYAKETNHIDLHKKYKNYGYGTALSMFQDGKIRKNKIVDIRFSGHRNVFSLTTKSGKKIVCTDNHKFPTPNGEKKLSQLMVGDTLFIKGTYEKTTKKYNLTNGSFESNIPQKGQRGFQVMQNGESHKFELIRTSKKDLQCSCEICDKKYSESKRFELHHKDGDRTNNESENLQWCCNSCHKKADYKLNRTKVFEKGIPTKTDEIISIEHIGTEDTYDIEMTNPAHNFVIDNGLVVSNSHSSAYGIISYLTAKQKAYYPKEFYAGLLNSYIGHGNFIKDKASEIIEDMQKHKIVLNPFNFRNDHRKCSILKNNILYAIPLIKDCNINMSEYLYSIRDNQYNTFVDLLYDLQNNKINSKQLEILIQLGFFSEFGNAKELIRIRDIFEYFNNGKMKSIKKEKLQQHPHFYNLVSKYATDKNVKGKELKSFTIMDIKNLLYECEQNIREENIKDYTLREKIGFQEEFLGYISLITGKNEDRPKLFIKNVYPVHRKKDGLCFGQSIISQSIGSGIITRFTIFNTDYERCGELEKGDIIYCNKWSRNGEYFTMTDYNFIL